MPNRDQAETRRHLFAINDDPEVYATTCDKMRSIYGSIENEDRMMPCWRTRGFTSRTAERRRRGGFNLCGDSGGV